MLDRFADAVLYVKPAVLAIACGSNDVFDGVPAQTTQSMIADVALALTYRD